MDELTKQSATKMADLIRTRAVSPVEVVEAHLRRFERLNPALNTIVTLAPDALDLARRAEAVLMGGGGVGALHGVPVTIKDTIETKGLRTTGGSALRAEFVPVKDAPSVARLKAAGAIVLGKTNVSEMAMSYDAENPVFGRTNNPHDVKRTPGGSSGGEAAAVSACMSPAGVGSDLTGSIRVPAHFCGIYGLKPTTGRVPSGGHFPPTIGPYSLGAAIGPMARYAEDLALLFSVLTGFNSCESFPSRPVPTPGFQGINLRGLRLAWYTDDGVTPVTEETRQAVRAAVRALGEAGLITSEQRPPAVHRGPGLWSALFAHTGLGHLRTVYAGREAEAGAFVRFLLASGDNRPPPKLDEFIGAWMERDLLRASLVEWMETTPLIVAPVGAAPAFEHGARRIEVEAQSVSIFRAFGYSQTFNVFDLPSVCSPVARSPEGLPIGVQIIGRPFEEETVLAAALILEESLGGSIPPQDISLA